MYTALQTKGQEHYMSFCHEFYLINYEGPKLSIFTGMLPSRKEISPKLHYAEKKLHSVSQSPSGLSTETTSSCIDLVYIYVFETIALPAYAFFMVRMVFRCTPIQLESTYKPLLTHLSVLAEHIHNTCNSN